MPGANSAACLCRLPHQSTQAGRDLRASFRQALELRSAQLGLLGCQAASPSRPLSSSLFTSTHIDTCAQAGRDLRAGLCQALKLRSGQLRLLGSQRAPPGRPLLPAGLLARAGAQAHIRQLYYNWPAPQCTPGHLLVPTSRDLPHEKNLQAELATTADSSTCLAVCKARQARIVALVLSCAQLCGCYSK